MEEVKKRKRGRPRKNPLPEEINQLVEEVKSKQTEIVVKDIDEEPPIKSTSEWDVPIGQKIEYFDKDLSYEITGYRPINDTQGLDFDPSWFTEARDTFNRTGQYCQFRKGSKAYADFWKEQYKRCKYGLTVNGYTVTGDHYFFLNFYQLKDLFSLEEAGAGRESIFPNFLEGQYEWFHYLKMAKKLKMNACMMKAREAGYSEIEAAIISNSYTVIRGSINVACSFAQTQLDKLLEKVFANIAFIDRYAPGFRHGRIVDTASLKRSGQYQMINGTKTPVGWLSQIQGIVVDKPGKLRGDRTDVLMFEEVGLWPGFTKAYTQADALVGQIGRQWGIRLLGGTGGEEGAQMEGLRKVYYKPHIFGVLPFKHKYTATGDETISAFFLPAFKTIKDTRLLDHRGYISEEEGRKYFDATRALKAEDPQELVQYCAEFCYNAEEAFSLEGDNKFNKVLIMEQLTKIRALKQCPPIEKGFLEYAFKDGKHAEENINGFKWIPNANGPIKILEHPLWNLPPRKDEEGNVVWAPPAEKIKNLYVIGIDGIDIGSGQTSDNTKNPSDFCLVVKKRVFGLDEPQYVAIYKDRPNDIREAYKIAIKLAQYYNATINIEATRQSIIPWAREKKLIKYFMKRPRATLGDSIKNTNKQYGTPATLQIIAHQTDLIADFINDYSHTLWFDEMLDEFSRYTDENKRKFDIVAAVAMAELADEELSGVIPKQVEVQNDTWQDVGYYKDEHGNTRWGVIPKKDEITVNYNNNFGQYVNTGYRTSDTRIYQGFL